MLSNLAHVMQTICLKLTGKCLELVVWFWNCWMTFFKLIATVLGLPKMDGFDRCCHRCITSNFIRALKFCTTQSNCLKEWKLTEVSTEGLDSLDLKWTWIVCEGRQLEHHYPILIPKSWLRLFRIWFKSTRNGYHIRQQDHCTFVPHWLAPIRHSVLRTPMKPNCSFWLVPQVLIIRLVSCLDCFLKINLIILGMKPISLLADSNYVRAFPGGVGQYKMGW